MMKKEKDDDKCSVCHEENLDVSYHIIEGKIGESADDLMYRFMMENPSPVIYCEKCLPEYAKDGAESDREAMVMKLTKVPD